LAPEQTGGYVGGEYIERPESVSTRGTYIPGKTQTIVKAEPGKTGDRTFHLYKYDQYGNLMSFGT